MNIQLWPTVLVYCSTLKRWSYIRDILDKFLPQPLCYILSEDLVLRKENNWTYLAFPTNGTIRQKRLNKRSLWNEDTTHDELSCSKTYRFDYRCQNIYICAWAQHHHDKWFTSLKITKSCSIYRSLVGSNNRYSLWGESM